MFFRADHFQSNQIHGIFSDTETLTHIILETQVTPPFQWNLVALLQNLKVNGHSSVLSFQLINPILVAF